MFHCCNRIFKPRDVFRDKRYLRMSLTPIKLVERAELSENIFQTSCDKYQFQFFFLFHLYSLQERSLKDKVSEQIKERKIDKI